MNRYEEMSREELLRELLERDARLAACDVEHAKSAEKKTREKLTRVMREQQVILDSVPVGICLLIDRRQVWVNPYSEQLFQFTRGELQGKSTRQQFPSEEAFERFGSMAYSELAEGHVYQTVQQMRRKDGSLIWVQFHGKALDPADLDKGTIWILEDITVSRELQNELLAKQSELEAANELLEQRVAERTSELEAAIAEQESFSYSVSHDLRAPIRHISGFSAILMAEHAAEIPAQARDYLQRINAASKRMGALIDHLLELSRVSKIPLKPQTVDLSCLANATLRMFQETEPSRRIQLKVERGMAALGDHTLLRLLLENLLGNAWKYTSKQQNPRIEFGRARHGGCEIYFVKDNGVGFEMAYREKIFQPFERLHGTEFDGAGIGLATVQRIVHRHGGNVWAEGEVDGGAAFYFTLQRNGCATF